jgi:hypothetical protein
MRQVSYCAVLLLAVTGLVYFVVFFTVTNRSTREVEDADIGPISIARQVVILEAHRYDCGKVVPSDEVDLSLQ